MLQIVQVSPASVEASEGIRIDLPCVAYIGFDGKRVVGSGGLAWGSGRCWVWLKIAHSDPSYAVPVMRQLRLLIAKARQLGETAVYTPRDANYPTSKKLLRVLGFYFFAMEDGNEVWRMILPRNETVT